MTSDIPIGTHIDLDAEQCVVLEYISMEQILGQTFKNPERIIIDKMRVVPERRPNPTIWIP